MQITGSSFSTASLLSSTYQESPQVSFMKAGDDADDDDDDAVDDDDDDADDVAFWCFEEKGGVGELWAGVAAAGRELLCYSLALPPGCSLSLQDMFCSAPHACAIHSFGPRRHGNKYGSKFRRNTCEEKREHLEQMRAAQVNAVEKTAWVYCDNNASAGILPLPTICTWWMTMPIWMIS